MTALRITKDYEESLIRKVDALRDAYDSPTGAPWPDRHSDEYDPYFSDLQLASLPRPLRVMHGAIEALKQKYPAFADNFTNELNQHDRVSFHIGNPETGIYKVTGNIKGWYKFPQFDGGHLPETHPEWQRLIEYVAIAAANRRESITNITPVNTVIRNSTSYRQIVRVLPSMLHLLPQHAREDIATAQRRSRRPPGSASIGFEEAKAAEAWLAKGLLAKARPDVNAIPVTCHTVADADTEDAIAIINGVRENGLY